MSEIQEKGITTGNWLLGTNLLYTTIDHAVIVSSHAAEGKGAEAVPCPSLFSGPSLPSLTLVGTERLGSRTPGPGTSWWEMKGQPRPQRQLKTREGQVQAEGSKRLWERAYQKFMARYRRVYSRKYIF